jgi:hypothetical protein
VNAAGPRDLATLASGLAVLGLTATAAVICLQAAYHWLVWLAGLGPDVLNGLATL